MSVAVLLGMNLEMEELVRKDGKRGRKAGTGTEVEVKDGAR